jgi:putative serine protease PepD
MNKRYATRAASLLVALTIGAGGAFAIFSAVNSTSTTTTVVRQVTVADAQPTTNANSLSVADIYRRAHEGVVEITVTEGTSTPYPFGNSQTQQAQGSGFVYDKAGNIITDQHVVDGATKVSVKFWNGATYKAHVVGTDASTDLAVIKVDGAPASILSPVTLGDSSALFVGDGVVAIGSPFGLEETVTTGIVSALHRQMTSPNGFAIDDSIQTDAAINHGNSGGALLNMQGEVIGVTAQIKSDSGGNDGIGFAVPSNTVKSVAAQLLANGTVKHAYLGISLGDAGATVGSVNAGTPAANAGLRAGDVITSFDGKKILTASQLRGQLALKQPGDTVVVGYTRNGKSHTTTVKLASRPN